MLGDTVIVCQNARCSTMGVVVVGGNANARTWGTLEDG